MGGVVVEAVEEDEEELVELVEGLCLGELVAEDRERVGNWFPRTGIG